MTIDEKIKLVQEKNEELKQLNEIIDEITQAVQNSIEYHKTKNKHIFLHKVSVFVKLFRFIGIKRYQVSCGNELLSYVKFDYKVEMMNEILVIVKKHKNIVETDINYLLTPNIK